MLKSKKLNGSLALIDDFFRFFFAYLYFYLIALLKRMQGLKALLEFYATKNNVSQNILLFFNKYKQKKTAINIIGFPYIHKTTSVDVPIKLQQKNIVS